MNKPDIPTVSDIRINRLIPVLMVLIVVTGLAGAALMNTTPTTGTIAVADADAPTVHITGGADIQFDGFGPDQSKTTVNTSQGNISVSGSGNATVQVDQMTGAETQLSEIDTDGEKLAVNPGDKERIVVAGAVTNATYGDATIDDGNTDFSYGATNNGATVEIGGMPQTGVGAVDADTGELLDRTEVDANGRATFSDLPSGNHDILIQESPQYLNIRPETDTDTKIKDVEVEIRFFAQGTDGAESVTTRTTSNGQVDMTGLPDNESFVVTATADGWVDRSIFVDNLFEQQNVYLLNESEQSVTKVFDYQDFSGEFGQRDTVLKIQRPIDGQFVTVQGDVIGATGEYRATMEQGERHRIVLLNRRTGETRVEGNFQPVTSGQQSIEIYSRNEIEITNIGPILQFTPSTGAVRAAETTFETTARERNSAVSELSVTVFERENGQLTELASESISSSGEVSQTVNLTNKDSSTAAVKISYELEDGTTGTRWQNYSIREQFNNQHSLLTVLGDFGGVLPSSSLNAFQTTTAVFISLLLSAVAGSRARLSSEGFGVVFVSALAGWSVIGWVGYGLVFASGVTLGALVMLRRGI